jgi:hypothetical protein
MSLAKGREKGDKDRRKRDGRRGIRGSKDSMIGVGASERRDGA